MPYIINGIIEALDSDPVIHPRAVGGIWDRPLRREGPGATPGAFDFDPPYLPKNSIAVIDAGEIPEAGAPDLVQALVNVWVRVPDTPEGRLAQEEILAGCVVALDQRVIEDGISGDCGMVEIADRFPGQVDPWVKGGRMAYLRLRVAGLAAGKRGA